MKYRIIQVILLGLLMIISAGAFSQNCLLKGQITDQDTKKPIPFVNVGVKDKLTGTIADANGKFEINLPCGLYTIVFSSVDYDKTILNVELKDNTTAFDVTMKKASYNLNMIVVSASKYEQKVEEAVSSIEILKPDMIETKNILSLDKAVEQVPGVAIIDNEPQIRSGSGFSSGMGSRVIILVDEIPMMRGDAGRPVWNFLPVEDIEQIEVLKGASSVIYGSSALNGAINIRTAYPKEKTQTMVTMHSGIYNTPVREYAKSWEGFNPVIAGASFLHSERLENFDYVLGGNLLSDPGYVGPPPGDTTVLFSNRGEYEKRVRLNFGTRVRSKKIENLTYGLNGNFMYNRNAQSFFWKDADTNIYRAYPNALTNFNEILFYVDPYIKYYTKKGTQHNLKTRWFFADNGADNDQTTKSHFLFNEYQIQKKIGTTIINAGIVNTYVTSVGKVFSGGLGDDKTSFSDNLAVYSQVEKKFFNALIFLVGARWEYYRINEHEENKPVFRTGMNAKLNKKTYVRASFGQGYRFPSIGERYITTNVGNFGFYPNPDLKSETSWNAEIGIKRLFKLFSFMGFFDVSGFWQEYQNYVEFNAGLWGNSDNFSENLGFKFLNTGDARVKGIDATITGEGKIFKNISMKLLAGYTYSMPQSLDPYGVYFTDTNQAFTFSYITTSSDTANYILKYRMQHLGKADAEIEWKKLKFGCSGRYYTFMQNIDKFFYNFDRPGFFTTGIKQYRKDNNEPNLIWDVRVSYNYKSHFTFSFVVNNLFNSEYSLRPITVEPPRMTMMQIIYKT